MTHQPQLWGPCAESRGRQGELFAAGPRESAERCPECEAYLVETSSGFWCCPRGHGRLKTPEHTDS